MTQAELPAGPTVGQTRALRELATHAATASALLARGEPGDTRLAQQQLEQCLRMAGALGLALDERTALACVTERVPEPRQAAAPRQATFRKEGEYWTISYRATFRLKDAVGLAYLARLLAVPGQEFHALDLVVTTARTSSRGGTAGPPPVQGDAGPLLDPQAKAAYRKRLRDLAEDLDEADAWGDAERAGRARDEIDAIKQQLAAAVGLGGRDRRSGASAERARVSVTKSVRNSIRRMGGYDPMLQDHLDLSVRTGTFLSYTPDPAVALAWRL